MSTTKNVLVRPRGSLRPWRVSTVVGLLFRTLKMLHWLCVGASVDHQVSELVEGFPWAAVAEGSKVVDSGGGSGGIRPSFLLKYVRQILNVLKFGEGPPKSECLTEWRSYLSTNRTSSQKMRFVKPYQVRACKLNFIEENVSSRLYCTSSFYLLAKIGSACSSILTTILATANRYELNVIATIPERVPDCPIIWVAETPLTQSAMYTILIIAIWVSSVRSAQVFLLILEI